MTPAQQHLHDRILIIKDLIGEATYSDRMTAEEFEEFEVRKLAAEADLDSFAAWVANGMPPL